MAGALVIIVFGVFTPCDRGVNFRWRTCSVWGDHRFRQTPINKEPKEYDTLVISWVNSLSLFGNFGRHLSSRHLRPPLAILQRGWEVLDRLWVFSHSATVLAEGIVKDKSLILGINLLWQAYKAAASSNFKKYGR